MLEFLEKLFNAPDKAKHHNLSEEEICKLLNTNADALEAFEQSYQDCTKRAGVSDNLFKVNSRQVAKMKEDIQTDVPEELQDVVSRIVDDFVAQTEVYVYDGKRQYLQDYTYALPEGNGVTREMVEKLPAELQPDLTGNMMKIDIPDSGRTLVSDYARFLQETDLQKKQHMYNHFRQGLDILDIDPITYKMIDKNPASMGYWLPRIVDAVDMDGFFKIPATKIIKVPITMLQLTRQDYMSLSRTTLDIVDEYCYRVFGLDQNKEYFIKTGTYSSKFDFRNARISAPKEIKELGEYLLFIHWQALQMAHYDLSGRNQPVIYGVSTTTEWVVRDFIPDVENNMTIYYGLPLRTEYRAFVDFDTDTVLGIHPYWDSEVMKKHFEKSMKEDPDSMHDHITYTANEERLAKRYEENKDKVAEHLKNILPDIDLKGQWSVDIMQNGDDFYLIDMATAERSAFYNETVPKELRNPTPENWLPDLGKNTED